MNDTYTRLKRNWLRFFFYGEIACFALSLLHYLPFDTNWVSWPQRAVMAGMIVCLFQLAPLCARYQKTAIFRTVQLVLTLVNVAISAIMIRNMAIYANYAAPGYVNPLSAGISIAAMLASWVATYQLYQAHSELLEETAPALAKKWRNLFPISLCVSLLTSFTSSLIAILVIYLQRNSSLIFSVLQTILGLAGEGIALVSIVYLYRTIRILEKEEV